MNYVFRISGAMFHKVTSVIAGSPWKVLALGFTLQIARAGSGGEGKRRGRGLAQPCASSLMELPWFPQKPTHPHFTPSPLRSSRSVKRIKHKPPYSALFSTSSHPNPIAFFSPYPFLHFFFVLSRCFTLFPPSLHPQLSTPRVTMTTSSPVMPIQGAKFLCHWRLSFSSGINFLVPTHGVSFGVVP